MVSFPVKIPLFIVVYCFLNTVEAQYLGRQNYKQFTNEDFIEKIDLISETFDVQTDKLISPSRIILLDNYLVIKDLDAQKHLHVMDVIKKKYIGQYINIGDESNEISSVGVFEENGKNTFIISDSHEKKYFYYEIEDFLNSSDSLKSRAMDDNGYTYFLNYDKKNEKLLYAGHFQENYRLYEKDLKSGEVKRYGELLSAPDGELNSIEVRNHLSVAKIVKRNNYVVFAYQGAPLLEVFDLDIKKFKSVLVPHNKESIYHTYEEEGKVEIGYTTGSLYEFLNIKLTDKYIYAVYRGQEFENTDPKKSVVYVFDYDLNPIKLYYLDHEVTSIAIYNDEIMYGLNISPLIRGEKGKILQYNLKK